MPGPPYDVAESLAMARAGSSRALGEVLEACRFYLLGVADREMDLGLRAKGGASDVVQETFLEAQRDFAQFRGESEAELLAWLRRLLLNNLSNFQRHYRGTTKRQVSREVEIAAGDGNGRQAPSIADDRPSPSVQMMAAERAQALRRVLERLSEDHRRVLLLRYEEGRSFDEIARLMDRTPNAARKLWGRAIESLQQAMDPTP